MAVAGAANSDKSINNIKVDDSAKIVLIDKYNTTGTDYKVITGKQFKSLGVAGGSNEAYSNGGIAAFISKVNGVNRVTYGVVRSMALQTTLSPTTTTVMLLRALTSRVTATWFTRSGMALRT